MKLIKLMPYLLPFVTVFIVILYLTSGSNITGYVVKEIEIDADITLITEKNSYIPEDALVIISLDDEITEISVKDFIKKSNNEFELTNYGYTGNYNYTLKLDEVVNNNLLNKGKHKLKMEVKYGEIILSSDEKEIVI